MQTHKKIIWLALLATVTLAGCHKIDNEANSKNDKKIAMTTGRVDTTAYQALMVDGKYETSKARGVSANRLNSNHNLKNFEKGLVNLSKDTFSVNDYYFREGQAIDREQVISWIDNRSKDNPTGLNPEDPNAPIIFQQVVEQDYIHKNSQDIAGMSLGIALNKIDYSQDPPHEIDYEQMVAEGKRVAGELLKQIREMKGLKNIPIMIGLFEQAPANDSIGGHYFAKTTSKNSEIGKWEDVSEKYFSLPAAEGTENITVTDGVNAKYIEFKNSVQGFFPNQSGFSAVAYYRDDSLIKVTIKIMTKYFSQTEINSFTQFVGKSVENTFNINSDIEVQINTIDGPQAMITKKSENGKAESYIFD